MTLISSVELDEIFLTGSQNVNTDRGNWLKAVVYILHLEVELYALLEALIGCSVQVVWAVKHKTIGDAFFDYDAAAFLRTELDSRNPDSDSFPQSASKPSSRRSNDSAKEVLAQVGFLHHENRFLAKLPSKLIARPGRFSRLTFAQRDGNTC